MTLATPLASHVSCVLRLDAALFGGAFQARPFHGGNTGSNPRSPNCCGQRGCHVGFPSRRRTAASVFRLPSNSVALESLLPQACRVLRRFGRRDLEILECADGGGERGALGGRAPVPVVRDAAPEDERGR